MMGNGKLTDHMSYTPECDTIDFADRFDFSTRTMPCASAGVTRENATISRLDEGDDFNLLI